MKRRSVLMSKKEWERAQAAADMSGETCNSFVRRAICHEAFLTFVKKNLRVLDNIIGDAFDNHILKFIKRRPGDDV